MKVPADLDVAALLGRPRAFLAGQRDRHQQNAACDDPCLDDLDGPHAEPLVGLGSPPVDPGQRLVATLERCGHGSEPARHFPP